MNEYFVVLSIKFYQTLPETQRFFVNADSGKEAYEKLYKQIVEQYKHPLAVKELTDVELLDIRRL